MSTSYKYFYSSDIIKISWDDLIHSQTCFLGGELQRVGKINTHLKNVKVAMSSNSQARAWNKIEDPVLNALRQLQNVWANISVPALKGDLVIPTQTGHKVLLKRHHHCWVPASVIAQVGEIARTWEGSVPDLSIQLLLVLTSTFAAQFLSNFKAV